MAIDIQSTKITWSALIVIAGIIGNQYVTHHRVEQNEERSKHNLEMLTDRTQYMPVIKANTQNIIKLNEELPKYRESNIELKEAIAVLSTIAKRMEKDRDEELRSRKELNGKVTSIQIEVSQIKSTLKSN